MIKQCTRTLSRTEKAQTESIAKAKHRKNAPATDLTKKQGLCTELGLTSKGRRGGSLESIWHSDGLSECRARFSPELEVRTAWRGFAWHLIGLACSCSQKECKGFYFHSLLELCYLSCHIGNFTYNRGRFPCTPCVVNSGMRQSPINTRRPEIVIC